MFQVLWPRPPVRGGQGLLAQPPAKVVYLRNSFEALLSESEIKVLAVVGQEGSTCWAHNGALFCRDSSYELLVIYQIKLNPAPTENLQWSRDVLAQDWWNEELLSGDFPLAAVRAEAVGEIPAWALWLPVLSGIWCTALSIGLSWCDLK